MIYYVDFKTKVGKWLQISKEPVSTGPSVANFSTKNSTRRKTLIWMSNWFLLYLAYIKCVDWCDLNPQNNQSSGFLFIQSSGFGLLNQLGNILLIRSCNIFLTMKKGEKWQFYETTLFTVRNINIFISKPFSKLKVP